MSSDIQLAEDGAVATITLNRPDDQNRLMLEHLEELGDIADQLASADHIHAVIVTGAAEAFFSAGLLNPDIRGALDKEDVLKIVFKANEVYDAFEALPQITIAAINGVILAGAVELALCCDIRLAADHISMMMPEAKWGGFPGAGGPVRLPGLVGHGRAMELIATGRQVDVTEMNAIGFIEHIYPAGKLQAEAMALAETIASNGPLATRGAKRIAKTRHQDGIEAARALSDQLRRELEFSEDVDEGIASHRENRTPVFKGR